MENLLTALYVIPNYQCNLACPHCTLHNYNIKYNEETFIETLVKTNANKCILFGGEPLLYFERFKRILETKKIHSISTNLLLLSKESLDLIKHYNISIATSWNLKRFTNDQLNKWFDNIKKVQCDVLITMTDDLITKSGTEKMFEILEHLDNFGTVKNIIFEQVVDDRMNEQHYEQVDNWLCNIHDNWHFKMNNAIEDKLEKCILDCSKVKTLEPNGILHNGCPQFKTVHIVNKCLSCELNKICKPCILQKHCTFPTKLYNKLKVNK